MTEIKEMEIVEEKKASFEPIAREVPYSCTRFVKNGRMNYVLQKSVPQRDGSGFKNYNLNVYPRDIGQLMVVVQAMYDDFARKED